MSNQQILTDTGTVLGILVSAAMVVRGLYKFGARLRELADAIKQAEHLGAIVQGNKDATERNTEELKTFRTEFSMKQTELAERVARLEGVQH